MFANAADFALDNDGIFSSVAVPPRDQLGRFLGELPGYNDDEDCTDCVDSVFALVAETVTTDLTDEVDEDLFVNYELTSEERAEVRRLSFIFYKWDYEYTPEYLTMLRKLDGLAWVRKRYGQVLYAGNQPDDQQIPTPSHCGNAVSCNKKYAYGWEENGHIHKRKVHTDCGMKVVYRATSDSCGRHGRKKPFWWSKLAEIRRYNKHSSL